MDKKKVVIVGAGEIGRAIGGALVAVGHRVDYWDSDRTKVEGERPPLETVPEADFVFVCVPSSALRSALMGIYSHLKPGAAVVTLTKGLEDKTNKSAEQLLAEVLPASQSVAVLGGPLLAEEIARGSIGFVVVGTTDRELVKSLTEIFAGSSIRVDGSGDPRAVALAGVMKNIYTLAISFAEALGWGDNARGFLVARALEEMRIMSTKLNLDGGVISGLPGLGDLVATAASKGSRNRQSAEELIKTGKAENRGEGMNSLEPLIFLLGGNLTEFPVLRMVADIVLNHETPAERLKTFFNQE
jgi:glycerol-3-phosphate dehydrogenase (NAD(P)+)